MNVCWIISQDIAPDLLDPKIIKDTGTSWGSWMTHIAYNTDNCICSDAMESNALLQHSFQKTCTLYITKDSYTKLKQPQNVNIFDGQFSNDEIINKDDIIALNLAVPGSDLVLLAGFDFTPLLTTDEKETRDARLEYYFNVRAIILAHAETQFVLVECDGDLASWVLELDNVTLDTVESVKSLLG